VPIFIPPGAPNYQGVTRVAPFHFGHCARIVPSTGTSTTRKAHKRSAYGASAHTGRTAQDSQSIRGRQLRVRAQRHSGVTGGVLGLCVDALSHYTRPNAVLTRSKAVDSASEGGPSVRSVCDLDCGSLRYSTRPEPQRDTGSATRLTRLGPRSCQAVKLRRNSAARGPVAFKQSSRDLNFHRTPCD
jgi:hypothetical protein